MPRRYKVEGTKTFLYWSVALLAIGLLFLKDGWLPSADVIERHGKPSDGDHFYLFNRSVAIVALIGSTVCAYVHRLVK